MLSFPYGADSDTPLSLLFVSQFFGSQARKEDSLSLSLRELNFFLISVYPRRNEALFDSSPIPLNVLCLVRFYSSGFRSLNYVDNFAAAESKVSFGCRMPLLLSMQIRDVIMSPKSDFIIINLVGDFLVKGDR